MSCWAKPLMPLRWLCLCRQKLHQRVILALRRFCQCSLATSCPACTDLCSQCSSAPARCTSPAYLSDIVEVPVWGSLLRQELLVRIKHNVQVEFLLQQHEAVVTEALNGAHSRDLAHPAVQQQADIPAPLLMAPAPLLGNQGSVPGGCLPGVDACIATSAPEVQRSIKLRRLLVQAWLVHSGPQTCAQGCICKYTCLCP